MAPANYGNKPSYTIHVYAGWEASVPRDIGRDPRAMVGHLLHSKTELVLARGVEHLPLRPPTPTPAYDDQATEEDGWLRLEERVG